MLELNKIYNMDRLEGMKEIESGSVDMILCDLPYGTTNNKWDIRLPFEPLWVEFKRITKKNAAIVLFSQMPYGAELIMSNKKMFRYEWIWEKTSAVGFLNANKMPLRAHENILVFYQALPTYNPQKTQGKPYIKTGNGESPTCGKQKKEMIKNHLDGMRSPRDIQKFKTPNNTNEKPIHPTQKPVDLCEYLIKTYTNEGEVVFDACMGSGTTAVAAINTNRRFIGFELDENYFEIARNRIEMTRKNLQIP